MMWLAPCGCVGTQCNTRARLHTQEAIKAAKSKADTGATQIAGLTNALSAVEKKVNELAKVT